MTRKYFRTLHKIFQILQLMMYFIQITNSETNKSDTGIINSATNVVGDEKKIIGDKTVPKKLSLTYDIAKICAGQLCIAKCCPNGKYVSNDKDCIPYDNGLELEFSDVPVYDKNIYDTGKTVQEVFNLVPKGFLNVSFTDAFDGSVVGLNTYLTEDGTLYVESPNAFKRWYPYNNTQFCLDYLSSTVPEPKFWVVFDGGYPIESDLYFVSCAMLISCVFLLLVLIVYCVLPELRNLGGLVLMSYVASLLGAFLLLAILQLLSKAEQNTEEACLILTFLIYFFFLASFCWMNIMSFDIWWTFRGYAKARLIHRRGERFKFLMYCLYAWGVPLAMTVALVILNNSNLSHIPWFITPKIPLMGCFLEGGERLVYLYTPMLMLIFSNWVFFLLTAYNVWRLNRGTSVLESAAAGTPAAHRTHRRRFMVYLKLSVIMGISWVLEAVSSIYPEFKVWYITDSYNLLIGIAIFLIFVCKKKILVKLIKRFRSWKQSEWAPQYSNSSKSRSSSTTDSDITQETPLQVCSNPKGVTHAYYDRPI